MLINQKKELYATSFNPLLVKPARPFPEEIAIPDEPMAGKQPLSKEAVSIVLKTVKYGAAADSFAEALEIGYKGFGEIACTDAAKEGISAFPEKRKPEFKK